MARDVPFEGRRGEEFKDGERILYIENVRAGSPDEPQLPMSDGCLGRMRKGIFGLAVWPTVYTVRDEGICAFTKVSHVWAGKG